MIKNNNNGHNTMTLRITIRILAAITTMMNYIISITVIIPTNLTNHNMIVLFRSFNIIATTTATTNHNNTNEYYDKRIYIVTMQGQGEGKGKGKGKDDDNPDDEEVII